MDAIQICPSRDINLNEDVNEDCYMKTIGGIWFHKGKTIKTKVGSKGSYIPSHFNQATMSRLGTENKRSKNVSQCLSSQYHARYYPR